jgi:predicted O-methyltransferase YrrM
VTQAQSHGQALWQLTSGFFMSARVVQTAWTLGVFELLGAEPYSAPGLAPKLGVDPTGLELLLIACTAIGILERSNDGRYRNAAIAENLRASTPASLVDVVAEATRLYEAWVALPETIRTGKPLHASSEDDTTALQGYLEGVYSTSLPEATRLAASHDFGNVRRVLDVGGGAGAYAIALARRWSELHVELLDRPAVVPIARDAISHAGLQDRIHVRSGDYHVTQLTAEYDVVLMMNVLHQERPAQAQSVLGKAARALVRGGRMVIQDVCLGPTSSGPAMAALLGVNAFLRRGGVVHSVASILEWLRQLHMDVIEQTQQPQTGFTTIIAVSR